MSRWEDSFKNHAFQTHWTAILDLQNELSAPSGSTANDSKEFFRLKKVVAYLNSLLISADPELIPLNTWNNFTGVCQNAFNQMNSFKTNGNFAHITNANNQLDDLLSYISPYVRNGKISAQAAGKAIKAYSVAATQHAKKLKEEGSATLEKIAEANSESEAYLAEIKTKLEKAEEFENLLLIDSEKRKSLKSQFAEFKDQSEQWHAKISDFNDKLTVGNEEEGSIILQIEEAKTKALESSSQTETELSNLQTKTRDLTNFYNDIFGNPNDEGKRAGGLKREIENRTQDLSDYETAQQKKHSTLSEKIESLLPGATSAGLATAYKERKESYDDSIENSTRVFYCSLIILSLMGLFLITDKVGWFYIDFIEIDDPIKLFNNFLFKLPITVPLVWVALFASKRRSQNMRLQQEYAHKEAIAKSYEGFKKQIENLADDKEEVLLKQLLQSSIESVGFNASSTLDKQHGDKMPILEELEKVTEFANLFKGK